MNDFTKEELHMLKNGIQYLSDRTSLSDGYLEAHNALGNKIQSMIDNYICKNHESDCLMKSGIISAVEGDIYTPFKCKHCEEFYR